MLQSARGSENVIKHKEWKMCNSTFYDRDLFNVRHARQAKVSVCLAMWVWEWWSKQVKSPVHLCSLRKKNKNKTLPRVGFRTVLVFTSWRSVEHRECWTCAWLLSLIFVVLMLLTNALQIHSGYRVYSQNKHISIEGKSLSLFTIIPADAKMLTDIFDILYEYWFFGPPSPPPIELVHIQ